jgi:hypothetical protein
MFRQEGTAVRRGVLEVGWIVSRCHHIVLYCQVIELWVPCRVYVVVGFLYG